LLSGGLAIFLFVTLLGEPNALEYTWAELYAADHRISFLLYVAGASGAFALYHYVRIHEQNNTVVSREKFAAPETSVSQKSLITDWSEVSKDMIDARFSMYSTLHPEVILGLENGYALASRLGSDRLNIEHVVWGLLSVTSVKMMFLRLGFSAEQLRDQLGGSPAGTQSSSTPEYDYDVWQCLFEAYAIASRNHDREIGTAELLLALVERSAALQEWFFGLGIDADMLLNMVA
jgi:hypothetical protein